MKALHLKKFVLAALLAAGFSASAHADHIASTAPDNLIGSALLANQGEDGVIATLNGLLDPDGTFGQDDMFKYEESALPTVHSHDGELFVIFEPEQPGYFVLKFGVGNQPEGTHNTYFFENLAPLGELAFTSDQVNGLIEGCQTNLSDCRLSYVAIIDGEDGVPPGGSVPEPATLILMGAGMAGMMIRRRRRG